MANTKSVKVGVSWGLCVEVVCVEVGKVPNGKLPSMIKFDHSWPNSSRKLPIECIQSIMAEVF